MVNSVGCLLFIGSRREEPREPCQSEHLDLIFQDTLRWPSEVGTEQRNLRGVNEAARRGGATCETHNMNWPATRALEYMTPRLRSMREAISYTLCWTSGHQSFDGGTTAAERLRSLSTSM